VTAPAFSVNALDCIESDESNKRKFVFNFNQKGNSMKSVITLLVSSLFAFSAFAAEPAKKDAPKAEVKKETPKTDAKKDAPKADAKK